MSVEITIEFERECFKCYGSSAWMRDKECDACDSTGRISTALGEQLLEFLERRGFKPSVPPIESGKGG